MRGVCLCNKYKFKYKTREINLFETSKSKMQTNWLIIILFHLRIVSFQLDYAIYKIVIQ